MTAHCPRSPILLVAAAQALVADTPPSSVRDARRFRDATAKTAAGDGFAFVQHVGYWSHFNARVARSAWPFQGACSLHTMARLAASWGVLRDRGDVGDLVVRYAPDGVHCSVGIVVHVDHRQSLPPGLQLTACSIARGSGEWAGRPRAVLHREWVRPDTGDRFIAWHEAPDQVVHRGRAA